VTHSYIPNHSIQSQQGAIRLSVGTHMQQNRPARQTKAARVRELEALLQEVLDWHDQPEDKQPREWAQIVREVRAAMGVEEGP